MRSNARGSDASVTLRFVGSFSNASNTGDGSVVTRRVLSPPGVEPDAVPVRVVGAAVLVEPDHDATAVASGVPQMEALRNEAVLLRRVEDPPVQGPCRLVRALDEDRATFAQQSFDQGGGLFDRRIRHLFGIRGGCCPPR